MQWVNGEPVQYLVFDRLEQGRGLRHFVSTREGGVSEGSYRSLNVAFHVGDERGRVRANRERLAQATGVPLEWWVCADQVHGTQVAVVTARDRGRGSRDPAAALAATDGLVTRNPDVCCVVQVADCVPILLYEPQARIVGALHVGWRGLAGGVLEAGLRQVRELGGEAERLLVGLGPAIGGCCFEVGDEVVEALNERTNMAQPGLKSRQDEPGKWRVNLSAVCATILRGQGVPAENMEDGAFCTCCRDNGRFFSARREGTETGRMAAGIMLRGL